MWPGIQTVFHVDHCCPEISGNNSTLRYVIARYEYLQLHRVNADRRFSNLLIKMLRNYVKLKHAIKNYTKSKKYAKLLLRKHMLPRRIWSVYVKPRGRREGPKNLGDTIEPGPGWPMPCPSSTRVTTPNLVAIAQKYGRRKRFRTKYWGRCVPAPR